MLNFGKGGPGVFRHMEKGRIDAPGARKLETNPTLHATFAGHTHIMLDLFVLQVLLFAYAACQCDINPWPSQISPQTLPCAISVTLLSKRPVIKPFVLVTR